MTMATLSSAKLPVWHTPAQPVPSLEVATMPRMSLVDLMGIGFEKSLVPSKPMLASLPWKVVSTLVVSPASAASCSMSEQALLSPPLHP